MIRKLPFQLLLHRGVGEGVDTLLPGLPYFNLDPYLIMVSVKQSGIKYHFLSLWYDSTWELNPDLSDHWRPLCSLGQCVKDGWIVSLNNYCEFDSRLLHSTYVLESEVI